MTRVSFPRMLIVVAALAALFHVAGGSAYFAGARDSLFKDFSGIVRASQEAQRIWAETQELAQKVRELERENEELRREKGVAPTQGSRKILAEVLWFEPDPFFIRTRINQGTEAGVVSGAIVTAPGGILLGKVREVFPRSAQVEYIGNPSFTFSVTMGKNETFGLARGAEQGLLSIAFVPREKLPLVGDTVRTAGQNDTIPQGLLVGTVVEASTSPKEPFARIRVRPEIEPENAFIVFVFLYAP